MKDYCFNPKSQCGWLLTLGTISLLALASPSLAETVPVGTCPTGTSPSTLVPNSHVCIKDVQANPCPPGTAEAFMGSETCLLDPNSIPKYVIPLVIPPVMPKSTTTAPGEPTAEYDIAVRQFEQQILPGGIWNSLNGRTDGFNPTTVWSYGRAEDPAPTGGVAPAFNSSFNYPAFTVESISGELDNVRWINDLVDDNGDYLPHLLAVDQTLHWANPIKDCRDNSNRTDCEGSSEAPYQGPVPMVTHVHGAHVNPESDGYPESWWLPAANDIPLGAATKGALFDQYNRANTMPGSAFYGYENDQPATTLWYHDHSLGMTRLNVYAGPAGFWLVRGGANGDDFVGDVTGATTGVLPGPAPVAGEGVLTTNVPNAIDAGGEREKYREIPIVIQDRSFTPDGSLFYPENRALFEGINTDQLAIPFINAADSDTVSDIAPIWNPEAFFNTMVVNGVTWPVMEVAADRYRFRLLDGCNSRTINLSMFVVDPETGDIDPTQEIPFYQIGSEQGFLPNVVKIQTNSFTVLPDGAPTALFDPQQALLLGPAERADVIVDFSGMPVGTTIRMINTAPDGPFGGFPDVAADPSTVGQVMQFVVRAPSELDALSTDGLTTAPADLILPAQMPLGPADNADAPRRLSLNEEESLQVCVQVALDGAVTDLMVDFDPIDPAVFLAACDLASGAPFAPKAALLGSISANLGGMGDTNLIARWMDDVTEEPIINETEIWEIYNRTVDAHPIHVHLVGFEVIDRQWLDTYITPAGDEVLVEPLTPVGPTMPTDGNELGFKDTVLSYPGQVTRIIAKFDRAGRYVWHCHIVEHEDNEMMRPYIVRYDPTNPDIDQDGDVDRTDYSLFMKEVLKAEPRNPGYDLNDDGVVDLQDSRIVLSFIRPVRSRGRSRR